MTPHMEAAAWQGRRNGEAPTKKHSKVERSAARGQFDAAAWERAAAGLGLGTAGRLVVSQLADRAGRTGRVRATPADLAASSCLGVLAVSDVLAGLGSHGLLGQRDRALVLVLPRPGGDPG